MDYGSDLHEPRTNAEQSETGGDLRVSYESRKALAHLNRVIASDKKAKKSRCATVYFIGGDTDSIKIGHSCYLAKRLAAIQAHSPIRVSVLASVPGQGARLELIYHARFEAHRLHGEWFERCAEIEAEIERLNKPAQRVQIPYNRIIGEV